MRSLLARVDHLVCGTPDLDSAVDELEERLGVRATPGGRHPGQGTRNALLALGPSSYLEILGPDPDQPDPARPRWLGVDEVKVPRLVAWAAKARDLPALLKRARAGGVALGDVASGSREGPDGRTMSWQLTDPDALVVGSALPFLIDWGETPHPAGRAPRGVELLELRAEHPDPVGVRPTLAWLGLDLAVQPGSAPVLVATLRTPRGAVELR